jgi:hypothetical protein
MEVGGQNHASAALLSDRTQYPLPETVWTIQRREERLDPSGIWTPDRPASRLVTSLTMLSATVVSNVWVQNFPEENYYKPLTKAAIQRFA